MGGTIVDLTLDDSDEDISPTKAAQDVLQSFLPRKEKNSNTFAGPIRDSRLKLNHGNQVVPATGDPPWYLPVTNSNHGLNPAESVTPAVGGNIDHLSHQPPLSLSALLQQESAGRPTPQSFSVQNGKAIENGSHVHAHMYSESQTGNSTRKHNRLGLPDNDGQSTWESAEGSMRHVRKQPTKIFNAITQPEHTQCLTETSTLQPSRRHSPPSTASLESSFTSFLRPFKRQKLERQESTDEQGHLTTNDLNSVGTEKPGAALTDDPAHDNESLLSTTATRQGQEAQLTPNNGANAKGLKNDGNSFGTAYTIQEDLLLRQLKENDKLDWSAIHRRFNGRTLASLQVRYSKLKKDSLANQHLTKTTPTSELVGAVRSRPNYSEAINLLGQIERKLRKHISQTSDQSPIHLGPHQFQEITQVPAINGSVSKKDKDQAEGASSKHDNFSKPTLPTGLLDSNHKWSAQSLRQEFSTFGNLLRQRELGFSNARARKLTLNPDGFKHHILDTLGPRQSYHGTSGDVNHVAWAPNGFVFACGSIAITDALSMQYNKPLNLVIGDVPNNTLQELPEHHITRPVIQSGVGNINGSNSMRESQDSRLFMTVASVAFSPEGDRLLSAGGDGAIRIYDISRFSERATTSSINSFNSHLRRSEEGRYEVFDSQMFKRPAAVDLLSVSYDGLVAAASRESVNGSLNIYHRQGELFDHAHCPTHPSATPRVYPTSLKWSPSPLHRHLLLAGFSGDTLNEDHVRAGEVSLWDAATQIRIPVGATFCNVFDVAWNPNPSPASTLFAVASARSSSNHNTSRGSVKSVVQCFAPNNGRTKRVVEFDCPALDINDVTYCPYDDNLIAAGATDGKVYVWDKRFADECQAPLHTFGHNETLSVIDHERNIEEADTGVRFLSWGATSSRLYSGSSDGVVKIWDPYRATEDSHVKDAAKFNSAIMSGAFSPDFRELLIGEDQGQVNLLGIGCEGKSGRAAKRFRLQAGAAPKDESSTSAYNLAHEMLESGKIELRPMGDLPKRQAVQGRLYDGPYLMPSAEEMTSAKFELAESLKGQCDARSQVDSETSQESDAGIHLQRADNRVRAAQENIQQLENRRLDFERLSLSAEALQRQFQKAQKKALELEIDMSIPIASCKLNCNFLPTANDDVKATDNEHSKSRIPTALWRSSRPRVDQPMLSLAELADYGLIHKCTRCFLNLAVKPSTGRQAICEACASKGKDTGICRNCGSSTPHCKPLCERCDFACFRCGQHADVSSDGSCVTCSNCRLAWEADALGYTPLNYSNERLDDLDDRMQRLQVLGDNDVGATEIERLASKCQETSLAEEPKNVRRLYKKH